MIYNTSAEMCLTSTNEFEVTVCMSVSNLFKLIADVEALLSCSDCCLCLQV